MFGARTVSLRSLGRAGGGGLTHPDAPHSHDRSLETGFETPRDERSVQVQEHLAIPYGASGFAESIPP